MDPALIAKLLIRGGVAAVFMAARKWESIHVAVLAIRASGQARRDEVSGDIYRRRVATPAKEGPH